LHTRRLRSFPSPSQFSQLYRTKPSVQSRPLRKCQNMSWLPQSHELVSEKKRMRFLLARRYSAHDACPSWRLDANVGAILIEAREMEVVLQGMRERLWLALSIRRRCVRWMYYVAEQAILQRPCSLSRRGVIVGLCALDKGVYGVERSFEAGGRILDKVKPVCSVSIHQWTAFYYTYPLYFIFAFLLRSRVREVGRSVRDFGSAFE
jgi:hypothetical protein